MDTSDESVASFLADQVATMSDRGLGGIKVQSNIAASGEAMTVSRAAHNLLSKARRDLAAGRSERAAEYVDRALRLPFDTMAEANAAVQEARRWRPAIRTG